MSRPQSVTTAEVLQSIKDKHPVTIGQLADEYSVTPQTVRRRIRELLQAGVAVMPTQLGYVSLDDLNEEERAFVQGFAIRWTGTAKRLGVEFSALQDSMHDMIARIPDATDDELQAIQNFMAQGAYLTAMEITRRRLGT